MSEEDEFEEAMQDIMPQAVLDVYQEEQEALLKRDEEANDRIERNTPFIVKVLVFLDPLGILTASNTSTASQPTAQHIVNERVDGAIQRIETRLGFTLDDETKSNIRADVSAMWGRPIRKAD